METNPQLERKRADFLQEAAKLVRSASAIGRAITADEDSRVLELIKKAHTIEEELLRLRRHHNEWKAGEFEPSLDGLRPALSYPKSDSPRSAPKGRTAKSIHAMESTGYFNCRREALCHSSRRSCSRSISLIVVSARLVTSR